MTCFGEEEQGESQSDLPLLLFSETPSAENSRYYKVPYFGVMCPELHQHAKIKV